MALIAGFQIMRQAIGAASLSGHPFQIRPLREIVMEHERMRNMAGHKNPCVAAVSEPDTKAKRATRFTPPQQNKRILCRVPPTAHDAIQAESEGAYAHTIPSRGDVFGGLK
jgi:hypothetical protein